MKLDYLLLDVFTDSPLKGNQLAVVTKGDGLLDGEMQAIAREFNLSETVFVLKPKGERNTAAIRIFTPHEELPFAGHPTIGSAVVLGLHKKVTAVRIEEKIGLVTALFEKKDKRSGEARFGLPMLPGRVAELNNTLGIAQALGLEVEDIGCDEYRPAVFSAGVPYHLVPVRNADALKRITVNNAIWNTVFKHEHHSAYVFTLTPNEPDNDLAARMFGMGVGEDPGTGSAAASLIGLLSEHANLATGQSDFVLRQGHEMGRPCRISIQLRKEQGELVHGGIGGHAVIVGEGVLDLGD
ncbi:PhzF family phenazine biosynthesis protein [Devosia sp. J2-20]|uniref:PhzF family phenazine biosynthesis protein n=1 Tax=Devosia litorisediminis TaxID=2829817 RepID=A0A942I5Q3_9HYPH|nr:MULTISPECIES: PhzF family phenazine biosynthesis protein [Devosia]MBS3847853.1 PhzF family phenazine biosynthesis protein [Devosia litorisediminis]WDQ99036.1 PhzF family phenazine biosynthesis protein [Devosia sp. J2-20]